LLHAAHVGVAAEALLLLGHLLLHAAHVGVAAEALLLLGHLLHATHVGVVTEALLWLGHLLQLVLGNGGISKDRLDRLVTTEGVFTLFGLTASYRQQQSDYREYALYLHGYQFLQI
jgi:hypothetical protein